MRVTINGEERGFDRPLTVEQMLGEMGLDARKVAVERNLELVPKSPSVLTHKSSKRGSNFQRRLGRMVYRHHSR